MLAIFSLCVFVCVCVCPCVSVFVYAMYILRINGYEYTVLGTPFDVDN